MALNCGTPGNLHRERTLVLSLLNYLRLEKVGAGRRMLGRLEVIRLRQKYLESLMKC